LSNSRDLPVSSRYRAYAKLNWDLYVFPIEQGCNLHRIDSLVVTVDVFDNIRIEISEGDCIEVECDVAPGKKNLVWKAVSEFLEHTKLELSVRVIIKKYIPHGAGMGGGSSDAMTTILALNELTEMNLPKKDILSIAKKVGSDLPIFMNKGWMRVSGFGDVVGGLNLPQRKFLVVKPAGSLATKDVYKKFDETAKQISIPTVPERLKKPFNSLQNPATVILPEVKEIIDMLARSDKHKNVSMTGSGSAVFAEVDKNYKIPYDTFNKNNWDYFLVQTI
jgi:4-diphosphocytidyl-2-C-methyl-D-erythritol kinase